MKRTPLWVFVAAVGVQLAALGLCLWGMERARHTAIDDDGTAASPEPPRERTEALPPAPPLTAADVALARGHVPAEPELEPEIVEARDVPEPAYAQAGATEPQPVPAPRPVVVRPAPPPSPAAPMFGPPPDRPPAPPPDPNAIPAYITDAAEPTAQVVRGEAAEGPFAFGFYPDGNIRFVDVDGGRYAGKAESARARMREDGGMRAFTVQIGVAPDGRLQAAFTGGPHDAQTFPLDPLPGWSAA